MTKAQKKLKELRDRQSRERQRMAEIGLAESMTDELRSELDEIEGGTPDLERQIRAAQVAVETEESAQVTETRDNDGPDAEARERIELRGRCSVANFLNAAVRGRTPTGAEAELAQAAGMDNPNEIPLEMWQHPPETETRAATGLPAAGQAVNLDVVWPAIFAPSIASRLMVAMPEVESGQWASWTIDTSLTAGAAAKGDAAAATAATFQTTVTAPKRISGRLEVRIEDLAGAGTNFESALRENLSLVMSDQFDHQAVNGDGSGANLTGLFARLTAPSDPSSVARFDDFIDLYSSGVDGLWSATCRDVGLLVGVAAYRLAAKTFRDSSDGTSDLGDTPFSDFAARSTGGLWTNSRMPAAKSSIEPGIRYALGRPGLRKATMPIWNRIAIDDIYSGSASGTRAFTAHIICGDLILNQPAAFSQVAIKVA